MENAPKKNISPILADIKHARKTPVSLMTKLREQNSQQTFFLENTIGKKYRKILVQRPNRFSFPKQF